MARNTNKSFVLKKKCNKNHIENEASVRIKKRRILFCFYCTTENKIVFRRAMHIGIGWEHFNKPSLISIDGQFKNHFD